MQNLPHLPEIDIKNSIYSFLLPQIGSECFILFPLPPCSRFSWLTFGLSSQPRIQLTKHYGCPSCFSIHIGDICYTLPSSTPIRSCPSLTQVLFTVSALGLSIWNSPETTSVAWTSLAWQNNLSFPMIRQETAFKGTFCVLLLGNNLIVILL